MNEQDQRFARECAFGRRRRIIRCSIMVAKYHNISFKESRKIYLAAFCRQLICWNNRFKYSEKGFTPCFMTQPAPMV